MSVFNLGRFTSHSGHALDWKVECDSLTDDDIGCLAFEIARNFTFRSVVGVPTGGDRIAAALRKYEREKYDTILIVDDVMTTGRSMEEVRMSLEQNPRDRIRGVVLFSRMSRPAPRWIFPVWQVWGS